MTRKTINVIIGCVFAFILVFFAGSFAYETYQIHKSDQQYEQQQKELDEIAKENQSGATNEEVKNN
jgi:cell division protein FtsB